MRDGWGTQEVERTHCVQAPAKEMHWLKGQWHTKKTIYHPRANRTIHMTQESEEPLSMHASEEPLGRPENAEPSEMPEGDELRGIKGWLLLVGLGVALTPVGMVRDMYTGYSGIFADGTWAAYTDPASLDYTPYFAASVIVEMLILLAMFLLSLWLAYLFFTLSPHFPPVFIGLLLATPVLFVLCDWLRTWPFPEATMFSENLVLDLIRACVQAAIWIPYMRLSKRVRHTFVDVPAEEEE